MNDAPSHMKTLKAVLLNDTSVANHHGCSIVVEMIKKQTLTHNIEIVHSIPLREPWNTELHQAKIMDARLVIVNGEGSVHSSRAFAHHLISVAQYCKAKRIPVFFINGVYQDNDVSMGQEMESFDRIFVRESQSAIELKNQGIISKVVPDMIFSFDAANTKDMKDKKPSEQSYIIYTDSVLGAVTEYLYKNYQLHKDQSLFLTMRCAPKKTKTFRNFFRAPLARLIKRTINGSEIYGWGHNKYCKNRQDLLSTIKDADIVITGRFHMICLCIILKVPFIAIASNSHKIEALLHDASLSDRLFDLERGVPIEEWRKSHPWTQKHDENAGIYLNYARESIQNMFDEIALVKPDHNSLMSA